VDQIVRDTIYQQLHKLLKDKILSNELKPGDKFDTERAISEKYNVSRITANKVISGLVSQGLLEIRRGIGTFVSSDLSPEGFRSLVSFTNKIYLSGRVPSSKVLLFRLIHRNEVDKDILDSFEIREPKDFYEIKRLRLADGKPMILEHRLIMAQYCPDFKESYLTESIFEIFSTKYNLNIIGSDEKILPMNANEEQASLLNMKANEACFMVASKGIMTDSSILWYEQSLHRPDSIEFRCQVRPYMDQRALDMNMK
jgi:GntR family transcriptional regulator